MKIIVLRLFLLDFWRLFGVFLATLFMFLATYVYFWRPKKNATSKQDVWRRQVTFKFLITEFRRKDNINFLFLTTFNKKTARMSGLEDETDNLLFIFFVDAHAVEIHALVGDLAKGFVVDKHPA